MSIVSLLVLFVALAVQFLNAAPSHAQVRPVDRPIANVQTNERGFTLDMFDGKLWTLARHPLSPASMSQLAKAEKVLAACQCRHAARQSSLCDGTA